MTAPLTVGVIGVGHLVRHMMPALVTGGHRFILSARNRDTVADLSKRFRLEVLEDNAEIVARCDIVILAVRPYDAVSVAGGLPWRADMTVLSLCAGVAAPRWGLPWRRPAWSWPCPRWRRSSPRAQPRCFPRMRHAAPYSRLAGR
jgi:hypothetical protein